LTFSHQTIGGFAYNYAEPCCTKDIDILRAILFSPKDDPVGLPPSGY
jgi:hypothetical protein